MFVQVQIQHCQANSLCAKIYQGEVFVGLLCKFYFPRMASRRLSSQNNFTERSWTPGSRLEDGAEFDPPNVQALAVGNVSMEIVDAGTINNQVRVERLMNTPCSL